jgi:hypothetical protein
VLTHEETWCDDHTEEERVPRSEGGSNPGDYVTGIADLTCIRSRFDGWLRRRHSTDSGCRVGPVEERLRRVFMSSRNRPIEDANRTLR